MPSVMTMRLGLDLPAATLAERLRAAAVEPENLRNELANIVMGDVAALGGAFVVTCDDVDSGTILADGSATATCVQASIVQDDTITIGTVVLTWRTSGSGENQVTIGASNAAAATNLAAAINAHTLLRGVLVATVATNVVTIIYRGADRLGRLIALTETGSGVTLSAAHLGSAATLSAEVVPPLTARRGI